MNRYKLTETKSTHSVTTFDQEPQKQVSTTSTLVREEWLDHINPRLQVVAQEHCEETVELPEGAPRTERHREEDLYYKEAFGMQSAYLIPSEALEKYRLTAEDDMDWTMSWLPPSEDFSEGAMLPKFTSSAWWPLSNPEAVFEALYGKH